MAELGHRVIALDIDEDKVQALQQAVSPIYEMGMDELLAKHRATGRLSFTTSYREALADAEFVFICVGTPSGEDGAPDLRQLHAAVTGIARHLPVDRAVTIVNKSTLPVGTSEAVEESLAEQAAPGVRFRVAVNPEFLREGRAVHDVFHPDRIVIGCADRRTGEALAQLYTGFDCPVLITDPRSAELIKYASNAFLATKISFANELSEFCERVEADISVVTKGMGMDPRIGSGHLVAGLGYGGSCLPKDVDALRSMGRRFNAPMPLLDATRDINSRQRLRFVELVRQAIGDRPGRTAAIWGLAFKEGTDDLRDAPSLEIVARLRETGINVRAYDPQAMGRAMPMLPDVALCPDLYEASRGADAVLLLTSWPEFRDADLLQVARLMRGNAVIDGRNFLDRDMVRSAGLSYRALGVANIGEVSTHARDAGGDSRNAHDG